LEQYGIAAIFLRATYLLDREVTRIHNYLNEAPTLVAGQEQLSIAPLCTVNNIAVVFIEFRPAL
jgi:hypothetical protein